MSKELLKEFRYKKEVHKMRKLAGGPWGVQSVSLIREHFSEK